MDKDFYFLIAIHFHQPIGNFGYVIEKACKRCYEPFLDTITEFPEIKFNLHYSGCLLEWIKQYKPKILLKLQKLIQKGQIELLGGGFYEPILPVLRQEDSIEQIKMFSKFLKRELGVSISGAWLAERVWEPHLAEVLANSGIKYTIVDDTHLRYAGLTQNQLYGYFITEEGGKCLSILSSDKFLRYAIPFHNQKETIAYFKKVKNNYKKNCILYADDGEKFGEWPGTNKWVYKKKWLYNFLKTLRNNASWVKTAKITDYIKKEKPQSKIYLPCASYQEMNQWALPVESSQRLENIINKLNKSSRIDRYIDFIRGGFWRNFFVKYPESNHMHKRMLLTSQRLHNLKTPTPSTNKKITFAKKELLRAQCNCAYWHGVFGGIYLYHLRSAIYKHLILADKVIDSLEQKTKNWIKIGQTDFDCDGNSEFIVATSRNTFIIDTAEGGAITEWDIKEKGVNIVNTLSRKKEAYHTKLKQLRRKREGRENYATIHKPHLNHKQITNKPLYYDSYRRGIFLDHFLDQGVNLKQIIANRYQEQGNFISGNYNKLNIQSRKDTYYIKLTKDGHVNNKSVNLSKRFLFYPKNNALSVRYEIISLSSGKFCVNFAPEFNFSLTQDNTEKELSRDSSIVLYDKIERLSINIDLSKKADKIFKFCVKTISQSERGIEENYQASSLIPVFNLSLDRHKPETVDIHIAIKTS